ncbi:hypothetical protein DFO67_13210 [Modicisalibacter xianhensis]|uniref:Uncharacterized protein n=1 Tax=Modicisalibacter xianhensis TaxID=442341 RepID=A0A4R8FI89_9GAMM|nr:hypothetical protein [Halomonas xianhensis]TDX21891.1 hypothetical protein DFO67_13210 [Halomonas xianhensis]
MDQFEGQTESPAVDHEQYEGATAEAEQADASGVSPTPEGDESFNAMDIINQMTSREGDEGAEPPAAEASEESESEDEEETTEEEQEEQDKDLPFHKHPRFQEVIAQKNEFKGLAEQREQELNGFKSEVQELFSGLDQQEVMDALEIARLMKSDPQAAFEKLTPVYSRAASLNGHILPDDLQQEVDSGYMTQERAQELARYRAQQEFQQSRDQASQKQRSEQEQQGQQDQVMQEATQGLEALEANWKKGDPDYEVKQGPIFDRFAVLMQQRMAEGQPLKSQQEVLDLAEKAKQEVEQRFAALRPKKKPVKQIRSTSPGATAKAKPQSVMDIINQHTS